MRKTGKAGVYLHVPFCAAHCPYCDFTVSVVRTVPHRAYADALLREWDERAPEIEGRERPTVYVGGGTPSLWEPAELVRVLDHIGGSPEEVTIEVNPEFCGEERLAVWRAGGVTRLSFGVQSFCDRTLALLGRAHSSAEALAAVARAVDAGFEHMSVDLIYAVPGEPEGRLAADLEIVASLEGVDHVSAYELTVEAKTPWAARVERGVVGRYDEGRAARDSARIEERLRAAGFARYEVSSYARAGGRSRHNGAYWTGDEYLGLGVGAHSLRVTPDAAHRRANDRSLRRYIEGRARAPRVEALDPTEHARELIMVGMRRAEGVDLAAIASRVAPVPGMESVVDAWSARAWVEREGTRVWPVGEGWLWVDAMGADALGG